VGTDGICVNTLAPGFTLSDTVVEENPGHVESSRAGAIARRALKRSGKLPPPNPPPPPGGRVSPGVVDGGVRAPLAPRGRVAKVTP
jgi:NAD(P)-dependent dehydrogenase (short-subunit alcohol dehydrogenase family)